MAAHRNTPARRARQRRDPAVFRPPPRVSGTINTAVQTLSLIARGRTYPIGASIEGDTPWSMGMDQSAQVTINVRDPSESLVNILDDESHLQQDGVVVRIDAVNYVVTAVDHEEGLYTLTLEDEVAWRLKLFSSYRQASRGTVTRFGFIQSLVDEAGRKPYPKIRSFIPEQYDRQKILRPKGT